MVAEIKQGTFKCERVGCEETVTAERPNNKRSSAQAEKAVVQHEQRDAIHVSMLDLSTLPLNPKKPDAPRSGYVVVLATTEGIAVFSKKILGRSSADLEASVFTQTLDYGDYERQRRGRQRLAKYGSVIANQQERDNLRLIDQLLELPVAAVKA